MPQVINPNGKVVNADVTQLPALAAAGWKVKKADIDAFQANPEGKTAIETDTDGNQQPPKIEDTNKPAQQSQAGKAQQQPRR